MKSIAIIFVVLMTSLLAQLVIIYLVPDDNGTKRASLKELLIYASVIPYKEFAQILYFYFLFKMKMVEIQLNYDSIPVEQVIIKIRKLHSKVLKTMLCYGLTILMFVGCQFTFGLLFIYSDEPPLQADKIIGVINVVVYNSANLFKIYLVLMNWRLGIELIKVLQETQKVSNLKHHTFLALVSIYLITLFLGFMVYWSYPTYFKFKE